MKTLLILGAGTGGTMAANKMAHHLDPNEWRIVIIDKDETHYYQPGFLFIPFGIYKPADVIKPKRNLLPSQVETIFAEIEMIEPDKNRVRLSNKQEISYDFLVVATGSHIHAEETPGMLDVSWQESIFDFYTIEGATKLGKFLETWSGGRMVLNIAEMPIKCPVAPLEFLFLADWYFQKRGIRNKVDLVLSTPLPGAFTKPQASAMLDDILEKKGISIEPEFTIMEVDNAKQVIRSYDEREVGYDLLVTIPVNKGADVIGASGMGDELNFIPTNKHTLQTEKWKNVFIIGDAGNVPSSKAGSVTHFMLDILVENLLAHMTGQEMKASFDGHANCFIESGFSKGILIDFNFEVEPLPGSFPLPAVGPFSLLQESFLNHVGKMGFKWIYWNILLKGLDIPFVESCMSMNGEKSTYEISGASLINQKFSIQGEQTMPDILKSVSFNEEGFMTSPTQWTKEIAVDLAKRESVELTDAHWKIVEFCRQNAATTGKAPTLRQITSGTGISTKDLFALFPKGPAKKVAKIAGLGKPEGCV